MRKLFAIALCMLSLAACDNSNKNASTAENERTDSLNRVIAQKDNEINDMLSTLNEIQEGFRQISAAENRVTLAKTGESSNRTSQIRSDMEFIAQTMKHNRELIAKLQRQAREGSVAAEQLKTTIEDKTKQIDVLRRELAQKDVRITELDQTVTTLNNDVENLKTETREKANTISNQDRQIHTAWYVFGTKKELAENRILEKGDVLKSNFNRNYFTKIDIRVDKEIKLYSKSAKILTSHPSSSYTLQRDASKQYILRITNPEVFWSTSKYLVVQVK